MKAADFWDPITFNNAADTANGFHLMTDSHTRKDLKRNENVNLNLE